MSLSSTSPRLRPFKPQPFGRYTLLMPVSVGGMGELFLARLANPQGADRLCVIKKILPHLAEDEDFVARFVNEGRLLVKLSHPHIAQVLDMGVHDDAPYLALEFIDGKDLRRVIARQRDRDLPLPLSFILYVMTRVLDALGYAHRKRGDDGKDLSLVHRDISPQNILIAYDGEVKVVDFGLAKSTLNITKTNPSIVMGKFLYMSPEQARHQPVDRRSDLYAVGLCLYELIAGHNPFEDVPPTQLMAQVANPTINPLSAVEPLCPPALDEVVMRSLLTDPKHRFQYAEDMRDALKLILAELDPNAGAQSASRFMRESFAQDYGSERKLLASLKEQSKLLAETPDNATPSPDVHSRATIEMPLFSDDATPLAGQALSFESTKKPEAADSLSFLPTRKPGAADAGFGLEDTAPGVVLGTLDDDDIEDTQKRKVLPKSRDDQATVADTPIFAAEAPSVVLDGLDAEPPPQSDLRNTLPLMPAATDAFAPTKKPDLAKKKKRAAPRTPPVGVRSTVPLETRPQSSEKGDREGDVANAPAKQKSSVMVWVAIPLAAVLAVGAYIAWDVFSERFKGELVDEPLAIQPLPPGPPGPPGERKSREVKLTPDGPPDELAPLPFEVKKPVARPVAPKLTASQKALAALRADLDRVEDASLVRKLRIKVLPLESAVSNNPEDTSSIGAIEALHKEVKAKLGDN